MAIEYRKNNKCRLVYYSGADAYGRPIRHIKTVSYTSKRNAEKQYREFVAEVEGGMKKDPNIYLSDIVNDYMDSRRRKGARSTTLEGYEVIIRRIADTLGNPIASKVTRKMIDEWIGMLHEAYSAKTIHNTVSFLSSCYERAVDLETLSKNPCKRANLPQNSKPERLILTAEDIAPFYEALCMEKTHQLDFVVAIELMLFCGLRRSEVCALTISSIDATNQTVHISDARIRIGTGRDLVEISGQLGHSQQSTTLNIYTHMFNGASIASKSIAEDIQKLISE